MLKVLIPFVFPTTDLNLNLRGRDVLAEGLSKEPWVPHLLGSRGPVVHGYKHSPYHRRLPFRDRYGDWRAETRGYSTTSVYSENSPSPSVHWLKILIIVTPVVTVCFPYKCRDPVPHRSLRREDGILSSTYLYFTVFFCFDLSWWGTVKNWRVYCVLKSTGTSFRWIKLKWKSRPLLNERFQFPSSLWRNWVLRPRRTTSWTSVTELWVDVPLTLKFTVMCSACFIASINDRPNFVVSNYCFVTEV